MAANPPGPRHGAMNMRPGQVQCRVCGEWNAAGDPCCRRCGRLLPALGTPARRAPDETSAVALEPSPLAPADGAEPPDGSATGERLDPYGPVGVVASRPLAGPPGPGRGLTGLVPALPAGSRPLTAPDLSSAIQPPVPLPEPAARDPAAAPRLQDLDIERFYPNNMGRYVFVALEELLGHNGLNAVLNLAGLSRFINNYPPNNMEKRFSFETYAAVNKAIEDFYGARGSKGLLLRVGKVSLTHALSMYTAFAGIGNLSMRLMPQSLKARITLTVIAQTFTRMSDQVSRLAEEPNAYIFENETCSMCWRRTSAQPCCHVATGVLIAALHWATGKNYRVTETQCLAMGAPTCRFVIDKQPIE